LDDFADVASMQPRLSACVFIDVSRDNAEADPCLVAVGGGILAIASRDRHRILDSSSAFPKKFGCALDPDPVEWVVGLVDHDRDARIASQVSHPSAIDAAIDHDRIVFGADSERLPDAANLPVRESSAPRNAARRGTGADARGVGEMSAINVFGEGVALAGS
jgi:hypothetical protein